MWLLVTSKKYKVERTYKQERPYNSTSSAARVATTWELCYRDDSMRRARATPRTTALRHAAHARPRYASPTRTTPRHVRRATLCALPLCTVPSYSAPRYSELRRRRRRRRDGGGGGNYCAHCCVTFYSQTGTRQHYGGNFLFIVQ